MVNCQEDQNQKVTERGVLVFRYKILLNRMAAMLIAVIISLSICIGDIKASDDMVYSENEIKNVSYEGKKYAYAIERTFDTVNQDEEIDFDGLHNGKKLVDVKYEVIASEPEKEVKEETQTKTYKDLESKNEEDLPQSISIGEVECKLVNYKFEKQDTIEHVSYKQQLGYSVKEPTNYAKTYDYTYTSPITNEEVTITLPFSHLEKGEEGWVDGFSAKVTLRNIDGEDFDFGDSTYTYADTEAPSFTADEYAYLIKRLGYSNKEYKLTSAKWSGKPYKHNGVTCRDAVCTGQQYGAMYEAVYVDDVTNKELYTATAEYSGSKEIETGNTIYTVKATAYYGKKGLNKVTVSIAVLLLILLIVAILSYISFSKKKKVSDSDTYKSL